MDRREEVLGALKKLHSLLSACKSEVIDHLDLLDLKIAQVHQINTIARYEYLTFSQFAEALDVTKPSVTEIVNKLIQKNCAKKSRCPNDGRIFYIELTEKGEKIATQEALRDEIVTDKILEVMDETELYIFVRSINKITC